MIGKRNILAYFLESKLWINYKKRIDNPVHWVLIDADRSRRMFAALSQNYTGVYVQEEIYDMLDCISYSSLSLKTKERLFKELDELETYHKEKGTLGNYV